MTRSVAVARKCVLPVICSVALTPLGAAAQEQEPAPNNGTDPTRLTSLAAVVYEYNDLDGGMERHSPRLELTLPFGEKQDYSLRFKVPVVSNDIAGDDSFGLGDVSVTGTHVFGLTQQRGLVAQAEMYFDTASRDELGTGKHVFKGTFIYARFLPKGIFAPALVHSLDVGGDSHRRDVNTTTIDLYYVPKFADPRTFVTLDPALNFDWEQDTRFGSLAIMAGRVVGKAFGGSAQVYAKPTVMFGNERPGDWSLEIAFRVLGF